MNPKLVTKRDDSDVCFRYFEFCEKLEANCLVWITWVFSCFRTIVVQLKQKVK